MDILLILIMISFLKSIILGSAFNFSLWFKYGREYWQWYDKTILQAKFIPKEEQVEKFKGNVRN